VVLSGARHLGKTTNARTFSDIYFDIERVEDLTRLDIEWGRHMRGEELVILDEIQHAPELFLRLRTIIDEQYGQNGRFLLTESFASPLIKSLEGGVIVCESPPFGGPDSMDKDWRQNSDQFVFEAQYHRP
jgi:predicted AAA+ superfamily ATPase